MSEGTEPVAISTPDSTAVAPVRQGSCTLSVSSLARSLVRAPVELAKSLNPDREQSDLARLAFYGTLAGLAVAEIIEPPMAVVIGVAHALASSRRPWMRAVGQGAEEAGE